MTGFPKAPKQSLHLALGVQEGKPIPQNVLDMASLSKGKLGEQARFAETIRGTASPWTKMNKQEKIK